MSYCIFGKSCRLRMTQLVSDQVVVCYIADGSYSFMPCVRDIIEALFELSLSVSFCGSGECFGCTFA